MLQFAEIHSSRKYVPKTHHCQDGFFNEWLCCENFFCKIDLVFRPTKIKKEANGKRWRD